ncbi:hypothetical protein [Oceanobacillus jeddahense]|uniref:Uncharacterized protein n=1 Tax=Oceanobacillus jeddahense TaxID=1462527 RepID=A0ABY5JYZ3_9BACI|nr:hypothetical protein [Oceanobacillus jeddahense]UUI04057.1 hypothetical protein NP439_05040 [Oceanobacillus jeddahense]
MNHFKRYTVIYVALIFISVIIIGFYVMDNKEIDFNWKTVSGDEEVVEDVLIFGDGQNNPNMASRYTMMPDPFRLSIDESKRIENPRGTLYGWNYQDQQMEEYVNEYKDFMRGKYYWAENFTETNNQLIYVDEDNLGWDFDEQNTLQVEVLDKETKEETEFDIPIEENLQVYGVDSTDVHDDKLYVHLFIEGQFNERTDIYEDESAILVIDLNNQSLEDIKFPDKDNEQKEDVFATLNFRDSGLIDGEMNYLYTYDEYQVTQDGGYQGDYPVKYELRLYNVEEDRFKSINLLEENVYASDYLHIYDNAVYSGVLQGSNYTLTKYDKNLEEQGAVFDENVLNGDLEVGQEDLYPLTNVHNGNFYIVFPAFSTMAVTDISISAFNLETGENVYEGIIQAEDSMNQYQHFDLYQLEFKNE